ncbi:MAG: pyridoxal phosphate-dependent aminotransferase [Thermoplasmatales archaeon]|nr:pyridoxal phosphate-dependent aminotransferase [Candidatus Thermoplasmatota archaeon]MDA8055872.1 pyridoxal phosphate-dependent aminotransferase [Thermoplasmatales archaeon]
MFISELEGSPSLEIVNLVLQKLARGEKVTSLAIGEPMYKTPKEIMDVAYKSMLDGDTHYTSSYGTQEVREAIVEKVNRKNKIKANTENTVFITAKQSVHAAMMAVAGKRSKILLPNPGYFYTEPALLAGLTPVRYPMNSDLSFNVSKVISMLDDETAAVMINSPGNPTGRVIEKKELEELYRACNSRGIKIISDEAYEDLVYNKDHFSIGSLEERPSMVITIFSLSKSYSMTGWRAGYTTGSKEMITNIARVLEHTYTCSPPFIQKASAFALRNGDGFINEFKLDFKKKKEHVEKRLSEMKEMKTYPIEGAFYAFPSYGVKMKSQDLAKGLLDKHQVAVLPGVAFGDAGEGHIRISFSGSMESIDRGFDALGQFLRSVS